MKVTLTIAREELRVLWRERIAILGMILLTLLCIIAVVTSLQGRQAIVAQRAHYQDQVNDAFAAQPDRHPHRMVHYGQFVFRTTTPWAAFDPGIDSFTGHTLFLEGHRQNTASFADVRQSSLLMRFGSLSPAFVLQILVPLLLVFIGHGMVARETETGTLRLLLSQGVRMRQLVTGKFLALLIVAWCLALPAMAGIVVMAWKAGAGPVGAASMMTAVLLIATYLLWLLLCAAVITVVSAMCQRMRDALLALLLVWTVGLILVPRMVPDVASERYPLMTRVETDMAITRDVAALGDSHNPDDPYFAQFRKDVLARYGVDKVEDLPVNYKGLVAMEGERITSALFNDYTARATAKQQEQGRLVDFVGLLDPVIALQRISMGIAQTDLFAYQLFVGQAEAYRYQLVQALNTLQTEEIGYADDRNPQKQNRVNHQHWHAMPVFEPVPERPVATLARIAPYIGVVLLWCGVLLGGLPLVARRLQRSMA